jgi:RNA polymerase sigma-70 factor (ECF subfamily)
LTEDGFASFFREQFSRIAFLLIKLGASRADAEDATQDALVLAWRKLDSIDDHAAWVYTVATRAYWRVLRTRPVPAPLPESAPATTTASDLGIFTEEQQHVLSVLRQLPLMQRVVLALIYDGLTCKDIAEVLGISEATVRSHLRHARNNLKKVVLSAWLPGLEAPQRTGVHGDQLRRPRVRSPGCLRPQSACRGRRDLRVTGRR